MKFKSLFFLSIILLLCSCTKKVAKKNPDFIGTWVNNSNSSFSASLSIDKNSHADYILSPYNSDEGHEHISGVAKFKGSSIKIGAFHYFGISDGPKEIDTSTSNVLVYGKKANWMVTINIPLSSGSGVYYKSDY